MSDLSWIRAHLHIFKLYTRHYQELLALQLIFFVLFNKLSDVVHIAHEGIHIPKVDEGVSESKLNGEHVGNGNSLEDWVYSPPNEGGEYEDNGDDDYRNKGNSNLEPGK